ncbi:MAG: hypothetical protein IKI04_02845 [Bacilli bacterium]|nr:hypothetical protein [Bacilli bacterium]
MNAKKKLLIIITFFFIGLVIIGSTYAFWAWNSNATKNVVFNTADNIKNYIVYDEGNSTFSGSFEATNTYTNGLHSTISMYKTSEVEDIDLTAIIHMNINAIGNNMKESSALKWLVTTGTSSNIGNELASGNFIGVNNGDVLTLATNIEVTTTESFYTIWIWLDRMEAPSEALSGETLDVNIWTEIDQDLGVEDRFAITRISNTYQLINVSVVNNKQNITNYAITTTNDTPSTWQTANSKSLFNLTYEAPDTGTYYIWFKDSSNKIISRSIEINEVNFDSPICTFSAWSDSEIVNNDQSTITLTCIDSSSTITSSSLIIDDITLSDDLITINSITKSTIQNGYSYTITITGHEDNGLVTLSLPARRIKNNHGLGNDVANSPQVAVLNPFRATFIYNGDNTLGSENVQSTTTECTINPGEDECTITIPSAVKNSVGTYNNSYAGLSENTGSMTETIGSNATTITLSEDETYYSLYRTAVTNYYPTSATEVTSQTLYRNQYFTNASTLSNTVLSSTNIGTNNFTPTTNANYSTITGFATSANTNTINYNDVQSLTQSNATTTYQVYSKSSIVTATFYYSTDTSGTVGSTTNTGTETTYLECENTSSAKTVVSPGSITAPTLSGETAPTGTTRITGFATANSNMSATTTYNTNTTKYYSIYRNNVSIVRPSSTSACSSITVYRNAYLDTANPTVGTTTYTKVIATANTGTSSMTSVSGLSGTYAGYSTSVNTSSVTSGLTTVATSIATRSETTYYAISTYTTSVTATFYYSKATSGTVGSATASANQTRNRYCSDTSTATNNLKSNATITAPTLSGETAPTGTARISGFATANSNMSTTTTYNTGTTKYYAVYRNNVSIVRPSSTSACSSITVYRNAYINTASPTVNTTTYTRVVATANTGTSNMTSVSGISGTFSGYSTSVNTSSITSGLTTVAASISTRSETTFYAISTYTTSVTATFNYASGSSTASTTASGTQTRNRYCSNATTATNNVKSNGAISVPSAVTSSSKAILKLGSLPYYGVSISSDSTSTTTSINTGTTAYYAVYKYSKTVNCVIDDSISSLANRGYAVAQAIGGSSVTYNHYATISSTIATCTQATVTLPSITCSGSGYSGYWHNKAGIAGTSNPSGSTQTNNADQTFNLTQWYAVCYKATS